MSVCPSRPVLMVAVVGWFAAACVPTPPVSTCETDKDCRDTHACTDGKCLPRGSAGSSGSASSSSMVASSTSMTGSSSGAGSSSVGSSSSSASATSSSSGVAVTSSSMAGSSGGGGSSSSSGDSSSSSQMGTPQAPVVTARSDLENPVATFSRMPGASGSVTFRCSLGGGSFDLCTSPLELGAVLQPHESSTICVREDVGGVTGPATCKPIKRGMLPRGFQENYVDGAALLPDGSMVIGGYFNLTDVEVEGRGLSRVTLDGSRDPVLRGATQGLGVRDEFANVVVPELGTSGMPTGKVLVGGRIYHWDGEPTQPMLMRLNADGTRDTTFNANGPGFHGYTWQAVTAILQERDPSTGLPTGRIYVGGYFDTTYNLFEYDSLVRLNADGSVDTTWNVGFTGFNDAVNALALDHDATTGAPTGKILVGGEFTRYNGVAVPRGLVRLNADGSLDTAFNAGGAGFGDDNASIRALLPERSSGGAYTGRMFVAGRFQQYNAVSVPRLVTRINADGTRDDTWLSTGSGAVGEDVGQLLQELDTQGMPTGRLFIAGHFWGFNGHPASGLRRGVIRLLADGQQDLSYNINGEGTEGYVYAMAQVRDAAGMPTGQLFIAGSFGRYEMANAACEGRNLQVLDANGGCNPAVRLRAVHGRVVGLAQHRAEDGSWLPSWWVGGEIEGYGGLSIPANIATVGPDGVVLNATTPSGANDRVLSVVPVLDGAGMFQGQVMLGGYMDRVGGEPNTPGHLVRMNLNGMPDLTFNGGGAGLLEPVYTVVQERGTNGLPTGNWLVGTGNTTYNGNPGTPRGILRVLPNGQLDTSFNSGGAGFDAGGRVRAILQERAADGTYTGRLFVGGTFSTYNGEAVPHGLVQLEANGTRTTLDIQLGTGVVNGAIHALLQPRNADGTYQDALLLGGAWDSFDGSVDGNRIRRLRSDGTLDATYNLGLDGFGRWSSVSALQDALDSSGMPTGETLVGGYLSEYNGIGVANHLVKLRADGSLDGADPFNARAGCNHGIDQVLLDTSALATVGPRIVVTGEFSGCENQPRLGVARYLIDGTLDESFQGQVR